MPLVSKTFDQLLDFTRTSSATFVGSNGLIQNTPASRNLLLQTQQFDNAAWAKSAATATANTTVAPDGTSTADTLLDTAATSSHYTYQTPSTLPVAGNTVTISAYAKASTLTYVTVGITDISSGSLYAVGVFNLSNGTVATSGAAGTGYSVTSTSITAVGDGWYRCSVTCVVGTSASFIRATVGTNKTGVITAGSGGFESYLGNGSSIYVWGAQAELGSTATTYTRNNGGVFPPRFEYDPVTLAPKGLLIEEQRTNLLYQSANFINVAWALTFATMTSGVSDPAGGTNAFTFTATAATAGVQQALAGTAGATYTTSFWIRRRTGTGQISLRCGDITAIPITVTSSWARYSVTGVPSTATVRAAVVIAVSGDEVDIWGAQLEAGAFATSYIPTVASQVTRTNDLTSIVAPNFASWFNPSEGTFVAEFDVLSVANTKQHNIVALYTTGTNDMRIWMWEGAPTIVRWSATNGTTQADINSSAVTANTVIKSAAAYKSNDFAASYNGAATVTDTSATVPTGFSLMNIGTYTGPTGTMCGHIRSIRYYPTRLTNAQLQALTA